MKKEIHPDYHLITVKLTDGSTYETRSTYQNKGSILNLEIDSASPPVQAGCEDGSISRFKIDPSF